MDVVLVPSVAGGLAGAGATYVLAHRDLGVLRALLAAAAAFVALALGWLLALYGAVVGLLLGVMVFAFARGRLGTGRALAAAACSYLVVAAGATTLIYASLSTM
jgi:hypothetical protein